MDIQSQNQSSIFRTTYGDYNLEWCRWKVLGSQMKKKKEIFNPNTKGYIHGALLLKNHIYAFFGPDQSKPNSSMYSFNFRSNEWKQWNDCNLPQSRDSFGYTVHQNEIFLFGGSSFDTQYGDLHAFNTMSCVWRKIQQQRCPSPRNPQIFTDINNQCIFLYGGINLQNGVIYNDAYLLINGQWVQFQYVENAPLNLIGSKFAVCNKKIFIFGGQYEDQYGIVRPNKHLYQLEINQSQSRVTFIPISYQSEKQPSPRTAHNMIGVSNQYIILLGGQSISNNKMLRDIWLYIVQRKSWKKIDPANGPIHPLSQNSLVLYNSSIFIFGGLTQHENMWNQQILTLQFGQSQPYRSEICTNCILRANIKDKQDKAYPKTIVLTSGFFYTISLEIKHPFQAIQMLYDCAAYLKANIFRIGVEKSLNQNEHIEIQFDGLTLQQKQFEQFICHAESSYEPFSRFMTNLKVACLRLGKTLIFVTADDIYRKVFLFSADSKVAPSFDENYGFFSYMQNIPKGTCQSHEGKSQKELILNVLRSRVANPENILNVRNTNKILIFQKNILVTSQRIYYYELISTNEDITVYKSSKKINFLQSLGYSIATQPEISLRSFLSISRLNYEGYPQIQIHRNGQKVLPSQYVKILESLESQGAIKSIEIPIKVQDVQFQYVLYITNTEQIIPNNLGILIYYNDRLVNRSKDFFGELFKQEFFKTKFKKAKNIFDFLGVISIKSGLTLNYLQTWFKKNKNYYAFIDNLRMSLTRAKLDKLQRNLKVDNEGGDVKIRKSRGMI